VLYALRIIKIFPPSNKLAKWHAYPGVLLAHLSTPAAGTMALVARFRGWLIDAGSAILAGIDIGIAGVNLSFAIIATEAGSALAGVQSFAGIKAGSAILAGSVVGAVVQILVAV